MRVHTLPSVPNMVFKTGTVLVCTWLFTACNAKITEPIRLQAVPGEITHEPMVVNYGVPDTSQVTFSPSAQTQVVDLTY